MQTLRATLSRICLTLSLVIIFLGGLVSAQTVDKIVAVVNEEVITQSDVERILATIEAEVKSIYQDPQEVEQELKRVRENIIQQMVEERLILCAAKKNEITVEEDTIETRIEQIEKRFSSAKEFEQALAAQGLTLKNLQDRFYDQEMMKRAVDYFVKSQVKIDPIEIKEYYQTHQEDFLDPEKAKIRSIFIKIDESGKEEEALEKARVLLERLRSGEAFTELAKAYVQGTDKQEATSQWLVEKGELIEELDEAIFNLSSGEYTDVIKTPQGFRIFQLEEKIPQRTLSFSQVQEKIKDILYKEKFATTFKKWLEELKQDAYIKYGD